MEYVNIRHRINKKRMIIRIKKNIRQRINKKRTIIRIKKLK